MKRAKLLPRALEESPKKSPPVWELLMRGGSGNRGRFHSWRNTAHVVFSRFVSTITRERWIFTSFVGTLTITCRSIHSAGHIYRPTLFEFGRNMQHVIYYITWMNFLGKKN